MENTVTDNDVRAMKIREIIDEGGHVYLIVLAPAPQQKKRKPTQTSQPFPQISTNDAETHFVGGSPKPDTSIPARGSMTIVDLDCGDCLFWTGWKTAEPLDMYPRNWYLRRL